MSSPDEEDVETVATESASAIVDNLKTLGSSFLEGLRFKSWWKSLAVYGGAAVAGIGLVSLLGTVRSRFSQKSFAEKCVVITGAARGLGKILARLMLEEGATVVIWDIDYHATDRTVRGFSAKHRGRVWGFKVDVSDPISVDRAYHQMTQRVSKKVDVLINNATIHRPAPLLECSVRDIRKVLKTNTMGHMWTIRRFLPDMIENDSGHIVCVCSMAGLAGVAGLQTYCASKFAVFGLTESLRLTLKSEGRNIDTTIVCPYYMKGPRFQGVNSPYMSLLEPEDVGTVILRGMKCRREVICIPDSLRTLTYSARLFASPATADWIQDVLGITQSNDEREFVPDQEGEQDDFLVAENPLVGSKQYVERD